MKKLKKSLSVLLTLVMLFTTLCFFVPEFDTEANAATTSSTGLSIVVPETIYLTPSTSPSTTGQYYVNNNADGSVKASYDTTAKVYIKYPGATKLESVTAKNSSGAEVSLNWTTFSPADLAGEDISGDCTVTLPVGVSAGNCELIEWEFKFTVNGETKTHYAYSVAYSPWYTPVGAATRASTPGEKLFAQSTVWVSGVHGYTANADDSKYWIAATNETFSNESKDVSGRGTYYPYLITSGTEQKAFVPLINGVQASDRTTEAVNHWLSASYAAGSTVENATFRYFSLSADNSKYGCLVADISPVANLTVDTSRYSNFNQIPNFTIGFNATDVQESAGTYWYISDFTAIANAATSAANSPKFYNWTKQCSGSEIVDDGHESEWFKNTGVLINGSADSANTVVADCEYNGVWNRTIEKTTNESHYDYVVKGALHSYKTYKSWGSTKYVRTYSINYAQLRVTNADKSALRAIVEKGSTFAKENYTADSWAAYNAELKAAALRLGNPVSADVTSTSLTSKMNELQTTVYLDGNGGTPSQATTAATVGENTTATFAPAATATKDGYTFKGWSTDKNAKTASENVTVGFNQTIYAVYEGNPQTLTLNLDGGTFASNLIYSPKAQTTVSGGNENSISYNITFGSDGLDISGKYSIKEGSAEATTTLPAWVYLEAGKTYKYSFTASNSTIQYYFFRGNEENTISDVGEHAATANANNATFAGLTANEDGSYTYTGTFVCGGSGDLAERSWEDAADATCFYQMRIDQDLTAKATETVTGDYWVKGLKIEAVDAETVKYVHPTDATLAIAAPTKKDYAFKGWSLNGTTTATDYTYKFTIGGNTLTAQWQDANYYVEFNANTGDGEMPTVKANIGENFTLPENAFTKTGYHFLGWSTEPSATSATYGDKAAVQLATTVSTVKLYAIWAKNDYIVNYVGGDGATGSVEPQSVKYDENVTLRANGFSKTGYKFAGWSDGVNTYVAGTDVKNLTTAENGTVTLTAVWTPITYTINFEIAGTTIKPLSVTYDENANRLPDGSGFNKTGYTFGGWVISGSDTAVTNDNYDTIVTVDGGTITLKAVESENTYTVVFNANGGDGTTESQTVKYTDAFTLNANGFTRTGYAFEGWATKADGKVEYADKTASLSKLSAEPGATVTLYAVWEANTYTVTFDKNDYNATGEMAPQTFIYDVKKALTSLGYSKTGYHFVEWNTQTDGKGTSYADAEEVSNLAADNGAEIKLYAVWAINEYKVTFNFKTATGEDTSVTKDVAHGVTFDTIVPDTFKNYYYTSDTTKDGEHYQFTSWNGKVDTITSDATFTAVYTSEKHSLIVDLKNSKTPTCTEDGVDAWYCSECGYAYQEPVKSPGHDWYEVSTTATCTAVGVTNYECKAVGCNATKQENTAALGHTDVGGKWETTTAATCTEDGESSHYCGRCNEVYDTKPIVAEGHKFGDNVTESPAGCITTGTKAHKQCTVCKKYFETEEGIMSENGKEDLTSFATSATGHNFSDVTPEAPATCTTNGTAAYKTCETCKLYFKDTAEANDADGKNTLDESFVLTATGHDFGVTITKKDATCLENGHEAYKQCDKCNLYFAENAAENSTDGKADTSTFTIAATGHAFGTTTIKQDATCLESGHEAYKQCNNCKLYFAENAEKNSTDGKEDTSTFTITATGHDFNEITKAEDATCLADGHKAYKQCSKCELYFAWDDNDVSGKNGKEDTSSFVIAAEGHKFTTTKAVAPDCENGGNLEYKHCSVCDKYFDESAGIKADNGAATNAAFLLAANGHSPATKNENTGSASCTVAGSYDVVTYCSVCTKELDREHKDGEKLPHTYTQQIIDAAHLKEAATCTTYAVYYYDCANCTANSKDDTTPVTFEYTAGGYDSNKHTGEVDKEEVSAKCGISGYTAGVFCNDCEKWVSGHDVIPALEHNWSDTYVSLGDGKDAKHSQTCLNGCGETKETNHTWDIGEETKVPSCTEKGIKTFTCTAKDCNAKYTTDIDTDPHTFGTWVEEVPATCTVDGTLGYKQCSECEDKFDADGKKLDSLVISAKGHTFGTWIAEDPATCIATGTKAHQYCSVCEKNFDENEVEIENLTIAIDSSNHKNTTNHVEQPANCTEIGYEAGTYCNDCKKWVSGHNEIPALEHNWSDTYVSLGDGKDAKHSQTCLNGCGETKETNHNWNSGVETTAPNCTEKGVKTFTCTATGCGATYTEDINANGHDYGAWVAEVPASCKDTGTKGHYNCSVCGKNFDISNNEIADLTIAKNPTNHVGDTETRIENKVPATSTTDGSYDEVVYCKSCSHEISRTPKTYSASDVLPNLPEDGTITVDMGEDGKSDKGLDEILGGDGNNDYTSSNDNITVDEDGKITADEDGTTTITVTTPDGEEIDVTVNVRTVKVITFVMKDKTTTVKAYNGDTVTPPTVADFTGTDGFIYKFKAWDKAVVKVNGNATYTAQYTKPCDYTELDELEDTLNEILDGSLADESVINANKDDIENVLNQIENINKDRNTRDESEQSVVDYVSGSIRDLIDVIYPDAGSELVITGAAVHYVGSVLDIKAVKMPVGTVLTDAVWTSSDDKVVFCSNGKLYAIGTGTVTLTATRGILKASKTITIVEGGNIRGINFTSINNTHFIVEDYYAVYNSAILYWSNDCELRFRVRVYHSFMFEDYIVYINGQAVEPDENGYFVVPAGTGDVRVTIAGAMIDTGAGEGATVTKWSFWEWLLNFFRQIINFFKNLGK